MSENHGRSFRARRLERWSSSITIAKGMSSLGTRTTVWLRYLHDTHYAGLAGGVDPVGFASGVGEGSVGLDRIVFDGMGFEELPVF